MKWGVGPRVPAGRGDRQIDTHIHTSPFVGPAQPFVGLAGAGDTHTDTHIVSGPSRAVGNLDTKQTDNTGITQVQVGNEARKHTAV